MPRQRPHNHIYMGDYNAMNGFCPFNRHQDMDQHCRFAGFRQNQQGFGFRGQNMFNVHVVNRRNSGRYNSHNAHRSARSSNNVDVPRAHRDNNDNNNNNANNNNNSSNNNGSSSGSNNNNSNGNNTNRAANNGAILREVCFICDDLMGNAPQPCIHLCDGGQHGIAVQPMEASCTVTTETIASASTDPPEIESSEERLNKILSNIKKQIPENCEAGVFEELEHFMTSRVQEVSDTQTENEEKKNALKKQMDDLKQKTSKLDEREKVLKKCEDRFGRDKKKFHESKKAELSEIKRQWQQLRDEVTRMEEVHKMQESRVRLDIGGRIFTTSTLTLSKDDKSMLGAMFSGRHELKKEDDGTIFIDRDGTHFKHILNYLRDGGLTVDTLPRNKQALKEIRNEAIYYQLNGLAQTCEKLLCYRS